MMSIEQIGQHIAAFTYLAMFMILFVSAMGLPIPEEAVLVAAGLAVGWGQAEFLPAVVACLLGIVAGDLLIFTMGRFHADWVLRLPPFKWLFTPKRQEKIRKLYDRHGGKTVLIGRFIPTVRFGVLVFAGQHRMSWGRFLAFDVGGALVSGPLTIWIAFAVARKIGDPARAAAMAQDFVGTFTNWIYAAVVVVLAIVLIRWVRQRRAGGEDER